MGNNRQRSPRDPSREPLILMYSSKPVLSGPHHPGRPIGVKAPGLLAGILYYEASSLMRPTKLSAQSTKTPSASRYISRGLEDEKLASEFEKRDAISTQVWLACKFPQSK